MRIRRSTLDAQAQAKMKCASAGQNEMRMRRSKLDAHAQAKMRYACAGQSEMSPRLKQAKAITLSWLEPVLDSSGTTTIIKLVRIST